jgi:hypothetical protein
MARRDEMEQYARRIAESRLWRQLSWTALCSGLYYPAELLEWLFTDHASAGGPMPEESERKIPYDGDH